MRPHLDIKHEGTTTGTKVRGFMDPAAAAKLMSMFIDLYADPALAVIREISTNGLDSHIAAGNSDPIEVTLPSDMSPTFKVKDQGVGMSRADIEEHYIAYGYSSKDGEDGDNFTGMLGMGSKAPLTYSSQFTVKAVKDGRQTIALMTRDVDGCLACQFVDERDTLDPNGVEIQVPVSRVHAFNDKAHNFFRFWEPGTVKVNGTQPPSIFDAQSEYKPNLLDPDVALLPLGTLHSDYIVMGNVPYPVDDQYKLALVRETKDRYGYRQTSSRKSYVVARVPIGVADFTPSREALQYTKRTIETLSDVRNWVAGVQDAAAKAEVEAAKDKAEALALARKWRESGVNPRFTYKGDDVPMNFPTKRAVKWSGKLDAPASTIGVPESVQTKSAMDKFHVVGFRGSRLDPTTKAKIAKYVADNGIDLYNGYGTYDRDGGILAYAFQPHDTWLPADRVVDITTIRAIDLGTAAPIRKKQPKYRVLDSSGETEDHDDLTDYAGKTLVVLDSYIRTPEYRRELASYANTYDAVVCLVSPSKRPAFFRNNSGCVDHIAYLKQQAKVVVKGCKPKDVRYMQSGDNDLPDALVGVSADDVLDPTVQALINDAGDSNKGTWTQDRYNRFTSVLHVARRSFLTNLLDPKLPEPSPATWDDRVAVVLDTYPHLKVTEADYNYVTDDLGHGRYQNIPYINSALMVEILNALYYARTEPKSDNNTNPTESESTQS